MNFSARILDSTSTSIEVGSWILNEVLIIYFWSVHSSFIDLNSFSDEDQLFSFGFDIVFGIVRSLSSILDSLQLLLTSQWHPTFSSRFTDGRFLFHRG